MSLGQGLERQTSRAAFGPGPSLWRQPRGPVHAALREALVNNKGKYKRRPGEAEPGIPSTSGNPREKWRSGVGAVQNREEKTRPSKRTAGGARIFAEDHVSRRIVFPCKSLLIQTVRRTEDGARHSYGPLWSMGDGAARTRTSCVECRP
jgi:hypothetical protein